MRTKELQRLQGIIFFLCFLLIFLLLVILLFSCYKLINHYWIKQALFCYDFFFFTWSIALKSDVFFLWIFRFLGGVWSSSSSSSSLSLCFVYLQIFSTYIYYIMRTLFASMLLKLLGIILYFVFFIYVWVFYNYVLDLYFD